MRHFGILFLTIFVMCVMVITAAGLYKAQQQPISLSSINPQAPDFISVDVSGQVSGGAIFYFSAVDRDSQKEVIITEDEFDWIESAILSTAQVQEGKWQEFKVTLGRKI